MQGYGHLRRGLERVSLAAALVTVAGATIAACSISPDTQPSRIVLPPTDALSTESAVQTTSTTTADVSTDDRATALPDWTIGRVIALAPRVDNARYHQGSVTQESPLQETSGFHFSTPDRAVNCSTGTNGSATLACRLNTQSPDTSAPPTDSGCEWAGNLVTSSAEGTQEGNCANRYPVLYRSTIVDYGHTISISRFSCLVETAGLFCIESRSKSGFAVTPTGYQPITAAERAPSELTGIPQSETDDGGVPTDEVEPETTRPTPPTS